MSKKVLDRLKAELSDRILETSSFRGDDQAIVAPKDWRAAAAFLRTDPQCAMDHFIEVTAADYPEREPDLPRFDVLLIVRSTKHNQRVRIKTRVGDGESVPSLVEVWPGASWAEREVFDMFGVRFEGHPDLRRILMYDEFVGYPLRKDYPIEKTQPLVPYRDVTGIEKLPPFGPDEGQPWTRLDWRERLEGRDVQVSPAIGAQQKQRPALSRGPEYQEDPRTEES
ncbi:MAG: NADH-quinone oxidoreductase subunit C [Sandaracinaceae bacterium]|nr:NADH-quinone oxidoreductase subunit C [Sandaracinaceae bacterium]